VEKEGQKAYEMYRKNTKEP